MPSRHDGRGGTAVSVRNSPRWFLVFDSVAAVTRFSPADELREHSSHYISTSLHAGRKGLVVAAKICLVLRHRLVIGVSLLATLLITTHETCRRADRCADACALA